MIFSTIIPPELVWDGFMAMENKVYTEISIGHITMVVEQISPTEARVVRLISPDPYDYIDPNKAPGAIINYMPSLGSKTL